MEGVTVSWWMWVLLGLGLMVGELLTPGGFYLIFFGVGAVAVGVVSLFLPFIPVTPQGLLFVAISVACLLFFRRPLLERMRRMSPELPVDQIAGETATVVEPIPPNALGKAEFRGTSWSAQNLTDAPIPAAQRCLVVRVDGLTLFVRPL